VNHRAAALEALDHIGEIPSNETHAASAIAHAILALVDAVERFEFPGTDLP
jgi:hypothetical protein